MGRQLERVLESLMTGRRGFTLVEILVASAVASLVAGGTLAAYVTAARMMRVAGNVQRAEAAGLASQTLERFRNRVSADTTQDPAWGDDWLNTNADGVWRTDSLPGSGGSESIIALGARRCYRLTPQDCDGVAGAGDCFQMDAAVCWNDLSGCPCP